jgi:hypothetical protein
LGAYSPRINFVGLASFSSYLGNQLRVTLDVVLTIFKFSIVTSILHHRPPHYHLLKCAKTHGFVPNRGEERGMSSLF